MDLEKYESIITSVARRYSRSRDELEDLEQIGRIGVWKELEKNRDPTRSYIITVVKNDIINYLKGERAKKRVPEAGFVSLHHQDEEDSTALEERIGKEYPLDFPRERSNDLIEELRKGYGRFYIEEIRKSNSPRKIVKDIFRTVIEDIHRIPKEEVPRKADYYFFVDNGLMPLLWVFYGNSPFRAVNDLYDKEHLPWGFIRKPKGFWRGKKGYANALSAVGWFVKAKNLKSVSDCRNITGEDFKELQLGTMLDKFFNASPFLALKTVFPELKPWQTKQTSQRFFYERKNQLDATLDFLMDNGIPPISELTPEETYSTGIKLVVSVGAMQKAGLTSLLVQFDKSVYKLYSELFPKQMLPWTLHGSKEPWRKNPKEVAARAIKWLFDDYLQIPTEEIPEYATCKLFWNVGFSGILTNREIGFNSSPYAAVDSAFPGRFSKLDFDRHRYINEISTKNLKKSWKKKQLMVK